MSLVPETHNRATPADSVATPSTTVGSSSSLSRIEFVIPLLPPSMNRIYYPDKFSGEMKLTKEALTFKARVREYIPPMKPSGLSQSGMLRFDGTFTYNFFFKNGKTRQVDTQNMLKIVIDTICQKIGIGDQFVKFGSWSSVHSEDRESVKVVLEEMP